MMPCSILCDCVKIVFSFLLLSLFRRAQCILYILYTCFMCFRSHLAFLMREMRVTKAYALYSFPLYACSKTQKTINERILCANVSGSIRWVGALRSNEHFSEHPNRTCTMDEVADNTRYHQPDSSGDGEHRKSTQRM